MKRVSAIHGTLLACAVLSSAGTVSASTPTMLWQDATQLGIRCLVEPTTLLDRQALENALCERIKTEVENGSALPVVVIQPGDPALIASGTVALLVHASVQAAQDGGDANQIAFFIRPYRATAEQTSPLFGAPPAVASLTDDGQIGAGFDRALQTALSQTLPWRAVGTPSAQPLPTQ